MKPLNVKENWDDLAERLRGRFSKLTESDVTFVEGRNDLMIDRIGTRLGKSHEQVETLIDSMNFVNS
jgi:hypothetical protein